MRMKDGALMVYKVFDVHSHIVPNVDDGSLNVDMSINMLRTAYKQGVRSIMCTSHDSCILDTYIKNLNKLQKRVIKENVDIKLYRGCEIYCDGNNTNEIINKLNSGNILTMNKTKYVLIEFNPCEIANIILRCVKNICSAGYIPIIAHTERYFELSMCSKYITLLQEYGCLFQINAYSIVNESDQEIKSFAIKLLNRKVVSFIGSDAHRTNHRNYIINDGINYIYNHYDSEYAKDVCYRNAQYMLNLN